MNYFKHSVEDFFPRRKCQANYIFSKALIDRSLILLSLTHSLIISDLSYQQPQPAFPFFGVNSKTLEKSKVNCHLENVIYTIQKHTLSLVHVRATD